MATTKKMTRTTTATTTADVETVKEEVNEYGQNDLIECRSITSGGLYIEGKRSGFLYTWADYNDVIDVEYRDLIFMIRSNDKSIFEPRIIITDENLVAQFPQLEKLYASIYSVADLKEIINLPVGQMSTEIDKLPTGAKNALRGIIATMIDNKSLDSVTKIKALDTIFGTNMLLTLAES